MLWLLLPLIVAVQAQEPAKELRPCFERYPNHRLVNVQPFHSEWRMRSEDNCLRFCALSSSRCRSIVFDSVQHICHYFLDEGRDVAIPAAKMVYLRVSSKDCLDGKSPVAEQIEEITPETVTQPAVEMPTPSVPLPVTLETPREAVGFAGSFDVDIPEDNNLRRDIQAPESIDRYQSSMEKLVKNNEDIGFKPKKRMEEVSAEVILESKKNVQEQLQKKLELLQKRFPNKYVELVGSSGEMMSTTTEEPTTTTEEHTTEEVTTRKTHRKSYKEQVGMVPKKISFQGDLRRKPARPELKSVALDASAVAAKAKMFLDSVNGDAEIEAPMATSLAPPTLKTPPPSGNGCDKDETAVWVMFENSLDRTQKSIDSSYSPSKEDCQQMCNQMDSCASFTFFDKEGLCQINENSEGLKLKAPPSNDYSATTSTRFCYPKTLIPFRGCSNFFGFRDLSLQVTPREQFEGLPTGYEGMKHCIELCVLSSEYICRSASFLIEEGRCLLNSEDSLIEPSQFQPTLTQDHLYFENACSSPGPLKGSAKSDVSVERVSLPKKSPMKQLQIKKLKTKEHLVKNSPNYKLQSEDESYLKKLVKRFF